MMVPMRVPYKVKVSRHLPSYSLAQRAQGQQTYKRRKKLKRSNKPPAKAGRAALLDIQLRKSHKIPIRQPNDEAPGIQRANVLGGHHHDVGDTTAQAGNPQTLLAAHIGRRETGRPGADEGAECHEGGNELLACCVEVPAEGGLGGLVAEDLLVFISDCGQK